MNSLFEDSVVRNSSFLGSPTGAQSFPVDIYQNDDDLVLTAAVPGMKPEDISITVLGGTLTIRGQVEAEPGERHYLRQEISYGAYERSFELPFAVQADRADATFTNGLVTVRLPKAEEAKPKQVQINVSSPAYSVR